MSEENLSPFHFTVVIIDVILLSDVFSANIFIFAIPKLSFITPVVLINLFGSNKSIFNFPNLYISAFDDLTKQIEKVINNNIFFININYLVLINIIFFILKITCY